jgi:hypothetical protein
LCIAVTLLVGLLVVLAPTYLGAGPVTSAPVTTGWSMTPAPPLPVDGDDRSVDIAVVAPALLVAVVLVAEGSAAVPSLARDVIGALGDGGSMASTDVAGGEDSYSRSASGSAASAVLSAIRLEPPGYVGRAGVFGFVGRSGTGFAESATWPD